jgi:hypothetical protein
LFSLFVATGGKFVTGVVDTRGAPFKFFSEAWGKMIQKT